MSCKREDILATTRRLMQQEATAIPSTQLCFLRLITLPMSAPGPEDSKHERFTRRSPHQKCRTSDKPQSIDV